MIEVFNELMSCISLVIDTLFNKLEVVEGIGYGWVLLSASALHLVVYMLFGRTK